MTLTIHTEEDQERQMAVTIEVKEARVEKAMRKTARKLAGDLNIPGFRRGKAPYSVLVRRFGRDAIRAEAIEELVQPVFEEALGQIEAVPYAQVSFDGMEAEPMVLKFTIPLAPEVKLGDYRELRKEIEPIVVTDEALEEAIQRVQDRHQALEPVEREVELTDMVTLAGTGELVAVEDETEESEAVEETDASDEAVEESETTEDNAEEAEDDALLEAEADAILADAANRVIFSEENIDLIMDSEKVFKGTPFVENIVGMIAGDEKTFTFTFADDFEDDELAGKEATFTVEILNVQSREVPAIDDELAKLEGDFETVAELRDSLKEQLQKEAENEAKNALMEGMIDDLLEDAEMVYPPAAVEQEIDQMMEQFKSQATRSGWEWDDFLKLQGQNEGDMREGFRETAVSRLKRQLALRQFVLDEKLTVETEDVDAHIDKQVAVFGDNEELQENMRDYYRTGYGFDMISSEILMDKAHKRIEAVLIGNAPDLDALEEAEESSAETDEEE
ncbi:MAG: trigger factor [Chloroflexi bacterium]|nr:trigger factor [Chloroflexota bacterium]